MKRYRRIIKWLALAHAMAALSGCTRTIVLQNDRGRIMLVDKNPIGECATTATLYADGTAYIQDAKTKTQLGGTVGNGISAAAGVAAGWIAAGGMGL